MNARQLQRRKEITERLWAVEDAATRQHAPEVLAAAERAVGELEELVRGLGGDADPLEAGRTRRYAADACFTWAANTNAELLERAHQMYLAAEPFVEAGGDPTEIAKLNFNLANTLRLLCRSADRSAMEEVKRRYYRSLQLFRTALPSVVPQVEEALQHTEGALRALLMMSSLQEGQERTRALMEKLKTAAPDDTEVDREVERELEALKSSAHSPAAQLQEMSALLDQIMPTMKAGAAPEEAARFEQQTRGELDRLFEEIDPEARREAEETDELFSYAVKVLTEQAERDGVPKERLESGLDVLEQFRHLAVQSPKTPEGMTANVEQMRGVISRFKHIYAGQGVEGAKPETRAGALVEHMQNLQGFVFDQMNQRLGETEQKTFFDFPRRLAETRRALTEAADDEAATLRVEHDRLRPLALAIRRAGLRRHLTLATPFWGWQKVDANPNFVFYAGGAELKRLVGEACRARTLELSEKSKGWGAGQVRWNQLRESAVGVFDLTTKGGELASVCHALGSALALGIYPVVVTAPGSHLPFDIDLPPVEFPEGAGAAETLGRAIDAALYGTHPTAGASSVDETARRVLAMSDGDDAPTRVLKKRLEGRTGLDPVEAAEVLGSLVAVNGRGRAALVLPLWPGFYPEEKGRRLFHVMPFSREWSNRSRDVVRKACGRRAKYRRGDETEEQQIIHSIWEEICRATHVLVDLTGLNPNVCLELGLAQALGRPTLLVAQEQAGTVEALFPEISKLQVKHYKDGDGGASLAAHVEAFLRQ